MRIFQLAILLFICVANGYGQPGRYQFGNIAVEITKEKKPKRIYANVVSANLDSLNRDTSWVGYRDSSWLRYIEKKVNRTIMYKNGAKPGKYIVTVQFIIAKDGSISDVKCYKDPGFGMCKEVMQALIKSPFWRPARQREDIDN